MEIIREHREEGGTRLRPTGECNIYSANELRSALLDVLGQQHVVELDLSAVTEIDTAGLQVLMAARNMARQSQDALRLLNPSPSVLGLIKVYGLADWLEDPLTESADTAATV